MNKKTISDIDVNGKNTRSTLTIEAGAEFRFFPQLADLLSEAVANNPELAAARSERDAAQQRIAPAGALEDPMLELGVINAPLDPLSLGREDMTMKMLGLSQKLPFAGKRDLRRAVATADADSMELAVQEASNQLVRDVRVAYEELAFNAESQRIVARTRTALEQLEAIARSRYDVGQAAQNDVLDSQIELERLKAQESFRHDPDVQVLAERIAAPARPYRTADADQCRCATTGSGFGARRRFRRPRDREPAAAAGLAGAGGAQYQIARSRPTRVLPGL